MVAGRVGASMAADIGTMKVTEQIDALRVMAVHPVDYLVLPRFVAMLISMPLLRRGEHHLRAAGLAHRSAVYGFGIPHRWFWDHVFEHTNETDLFCGMIKGFVFGILITLDLVPPGPDRRERRGGVGIGTTRAVVFSSLALLIVNFFLSILLN